MPSDEQFLYSQDLSNRKTGIEVLTHFFSFLYSQDLSNRKTDGKNILRRY